MSFFIETHVDLKKHASMALPSTADHFVEVNNLESLQRALIFAKENHLEVIILGEGSNSLFISNIKSLVIKIQLKGLDIITPDDPDSIDKSNRILIAHAGENWDNFVKYAISNNCYGLENLSWIPGAVGAAPIQNIGAYGVELSSVLEWVEVIDITSDEFTTKRMSADECQLAYRESVFKQALKDKVIITKVAVRLSTTKNFHLEYGTLNNILGEQAADLTLQQVRDTVIGIRQSKLPDPTNLPNAGSFFKNPIIRHKEFARLKSKHEHIPCYPVDDLNCKIPAAWLIDKAGWKGVRKGPVGVHDKQALVLINYDNASGASLINLAKDIKRDIQKKYKIQLEIEPRIYL